MTKKEKLQAEQESVKWLKDHLKRDSAIYASVIRVNSAGTSRHIAFYIPVKQTDLEGREELRIFNVTHFIAKALQSRRNLDTGGIVASGFADDIVYALAYKLFNNEYALKMERI